MFKKLVRILTAVCIVLVQIVLPLPFYGTPVSAAGMHVCSGNFGENVKYSMYVYTYNERPSTGAEYSNKDRLYYKFELTISGTGPMTNLLGESSAAPWLLNNEQNKFLYEQYGVIPNFIDVIIKDGVTTIGDYAFYGNSSVNYFGSSTASRYSSVSIGNTVQTIGKYAFKDSAILYSITLPPSVITIKEGAFENCTALTSIKIPDNVTSIGTGAFKGSKKLASVAMSENSRLISIGANAFENCPIERIEIPPSVTSIGENAFANGDERNATAFIPYGNIYLANNALYSAKTIFRYEIGSGGVSIAEIANNTSFALKERSIDFSNETVFGHPIVSVGKNYRKYVKICSVHTSQSFDEEGYCKLCDYGCAHDGVKLIQKNDMHQTICTNCGVVVAEENCTGGTATCESKAVCTVCGNEYGEFGAHSENIITSEIPAACESDGLARYAVCSVCGKTLSEREPIPALGHSFTNYVSNGDGTKTAHCDREGCDATDTIEDTDSECEKNGHSFTNYVSNYDATCTEDGTKTAKCDRCNATDTVTDIGSKGHNFSNYVTYTYATCTEDGTKIAKCYNCGTQDIVPAVGSKLGHYSDVFQINNDATCTKDGTKIMKCRRCSALETVTNVGSAKGHSFTNYISNSDGTKTAYCDREGCDAKNTITDSSYECTIKGHSFTIYAWNYDATCTKDGTKTAKCDRCDAEDTVTVEGTKRGHNISNYKSNNDAVCTVDGTKTGVCTRCGESVTVSDVGSAKGHSFTKYVGNGDATCIFKGTETAKCDRCDVTDTREASFISPPPGAVTKHDMQYTSNNDATCTEDGTKTGACTLCGKSETVPDVGSAKGHRFGTNWKSDGNNHWHECECGEKSEIAGHTPDEGTSDPETGKKVFRCTVCGAVTGEINGGLLGDVNGDGKINNTDIILLGRAYMAGNGNDYLDVADMNGDGKITNTDIILLGRLYMSMQQ